MLFQNRLPLPLREKRPELSPEQAAPKAAEEETKKEESKEQSSLAKKEESYDVGSEGERSDDEHRKKRDQKRLEKE